MRINTNTYHAIMSNALRAFERDAWLLEAAELAEATGQPVGEIVEGMFSPFCDRLIAASEELPEAQVERARSHFFKEFTEMAIG